MPRNSESPMMYMFLIEFLFTNCMYETPTAATIPNKIQKIAAKIGNGIDAKKAPNFPNMEKKIINPVDIWITLLLPTFVSPRSPMFSLHYIKGKGSFQFTNEHKYKETKSYSHAM
jgi:hypothetical protein